jgi:hypothetical protein
MELYMKNSVRVIVTSDLNKSTLVNTQTSYLVDSNVCQLYTQDTLLQFHCYSGEGNTPE